MCMQLVSGEVPLAVSLAEREQNLISVPIRALVSSL